jgi:hypothetical protein
VTYSNVGLCLAGTHILPDRLTGNHYRDILLHELPNCWKMYNWQSEHGCGTRMMVLPHILAVLCEKFSEIPVMTDE